MPGDDVLRVRRYVGPTVDDLELVDEYELTGRGPELSAVLDADWAWGHTRAGRRWRIVVDDPAGDLPGRLSIEGAAEWQDDRDQDREDVHEAFGWKARP